MQRLITSLKFVNITKCDNFCSSIMHGHPSLIISDQEDESIWKILAMLN